MTAKRRTAPLKLASRAGALSTITAGLVAGGAVLALGPPLAMGLAIWSGQTTEPVRPDLAYPWWAHALCLAVAGGGHALGQRRPGATAELLLHGGAVGSVLVPILALVRLVGAT